MFFPNKFTAISENYRTRTRNSAETRAKSITNDVITSIEKKVKEEIVWQNEIMGCTFITVIRLLLLLML